MTVKADGASDYSVSPTDSFPGVATSATGVWLGSASCYGEKASLIFDWVEMDGR